MLALYLGVWASLVIRVEVNTKVETLADPDEKKNDDQGFVRKPHGKNLSATVTCSHPVLAW